MELDPNVQVALVSVIATFITTLGVIAVAVINNRKERAKAADAGVEAGLDEKDVLTRILALISENDEKAKKILEDSARMAALEADNRMLRAENTALRLGQITNNNDSDGDKMSEKSSPLEEMKSESAQQAKDPKTRALLAALLALWLVTLAALVGVGWYAYFDQKDKSQSLAQQVALACESGDFGAVSGG